MAGAGARSVVSGRTTRCGLGCGRTSWGLAADRPRLSAMMRRPARPLQPSGPSSGRSGRPRRPRKWSRRKWPRGKSPRAKSPRGKWSAGLENCAGADQFAVQRWIALGPPVPFGTGKCWPWRLPRYCEAEPARTGWPLDDMRVPESAVALGRRLGKCSVVVQTLSPSQLQLDDHVVCGASPGRPGGAAPGPGRSRAGRNKITS